MMKAVATLMGANESTLVYMDKVYEFEKELAKVRAVILYNRLDLIGYCSKQN